MNAQYFDRARAAYRAGDFSSAARMFLAAKDPGEVSGAADHLRGNSLMKLGKYAEAAQAYTEALQDNSYGKAGALLTNRGKALTATGDLEGAAESFTEATKDATYATPYKAYMGLANVLLKLDRVTDAGVAFRSAAIDGANPAPASALASLGDCFMKLNRPGDAAESYLTALDYVGPHDDPRPIEAGLGSAYVGAGRYTEALDAFGRATADGLYQLSDDQQQDLEAANDKIAAQRSMSAAASQAPGMMVDPLDPTGATGGFMPDPSDTGFFTLTESEMIQQDRQDKKVRRKRRHTGLKVFIVILILLVLAAGGLFFAYRSGFGFPSQQDAVSGLITAASEGGDTDQYLSPNLSDDAKSMLVSGVSNLEGSTATVTSLEAGMMESDATVDVQLPQGGTVTYDVHFVRSSNYIGWAVETMTMDFGNVTDEGGTTVDGAETPTATDATATMGTDEATTADGTTGIDTADDGSGAADGIDTADTTGTDAADDAETATDTDVA